MSALATCATEPGQSRVLGPVRALPGSPGEITTVSVIRIADHFLLVGLRSGTLIARTRVLARARLSVQWEGWSPGGDHRVMDVEGMAVGVARDLPATQFAQAVRARDRFHVPVLVPHRIPHTPDTVGAALDRGLTVGDAGVTAETISEIADLGLQKTYSVFLSVSTYFLPSFV